VMVFTESISGEPIRKVVRAKCDASYALLYESEKGVTKAPMTTE
jgi:hypothetical protein